MIFDMIFDALNKKEKEKEKHKVEVDPALFLVSCSANFKKASNAFLNLSQMTEGLIKARKYDRMLKKDPTLDLTDDPDFQESVIFIKNANNILEKNVADVFAALESLKIVCSMGVKKEE